MCCCVVVSVVLTACSSSSSGRVANTLPPVSEPPVSDPVTSFASSTPPASTWAFHVTSPQGWEYDVSATSDMKLNYGKDATMSRSGMSRLTLDGSGSLQLQFTPTKTDATEPTVAVRELHITFPDGFITGAHCGAGGQPLCVPILTPDNSADAEAGEVDKVLAIRKGSPYYFEVRPVATVCDFGLFPDGTVRPIEEFGKSACTFTGTQVRTGM